MSARLDFPAAITPVSLRFRSVTGRSPAVSAGRKSASASGPNKPAVTSVRRSIGLLRREAPRSLAAPGPANDAGTADDVGAKILQAQTAPAFAKSAMTRA